MFFIMNMLEKFAPIKAFLALAEAGEECSVRGLAKKAGIGVGTAKHCLDWMLSKRLVKRKIIGKTHQYILNLENVMTRYAKILNSLNAIQESGLVDELAKLPVLSLVLYGSTARGDDSPKSDMDFLIISRKDMKMPAPKAKLEREATFVCRTLAEWRKTAKEDKPFYERIITEGITLYGDLPIVS
ncbi:MAG: nucleotidyltransferase domain-containing protein [Nanoarchaeota archaeon]|nr:nucleotidyltransferase domain-containing protein [Nanoarchaeota archaeon]